METQGPTTGGGGDGAPAISMHDVGPAPQALAVAEDGTPPACPASYRVPPRASYIPKAIVHPGPREDRMPKCWSHRPVTAILHESPRSTTGRTTTKATRIRNIFEGEGEGSRTRVPREKLAEVPEVRSPSFRGHERLWGRQSTDVGS